jgi:SAM-dependent methyltransferase
MSAILDQVGPDERLRAVDPLCGEAADPVVMTQCRGFRIIRCQRCGLAWSDPHLADSALARLVYAEDYVADRWKLPRRHPLPSRVWRSIRSLFAPIGHVEKRWAFIRRWLPVDQPLDVLEVGCWTGELLAFAAQQAPRWRLKGIDSSAFAIERAKGSGLDVRLAALEDAGFEDGAFAGLIAWNLLEHTRDPLAFLADARRVLQPGGRCILHLPNFGGLQSRLRGPNWSELLPEQHRWHFTCRALERLLHAAEARIVHLNSPPLGVGTQTYAVVEWT